LEDETIDRQQFVITLALSDVKSAGFFNEDVYNDYFAESNDAEASDSATELQAGFTSHQS